MPFQLSQPGIPLAKRLLDLVLVIPGLVLVAPLMLIVMLVVRIKLGAPTIFRQVRPGYKGRLFTMYKFRTMTEECDLNGTLLPEAQRLTRTGRALRAASLDELPELINVLRGEMSLVGPRPLLVQYLQRYTTEQMRRHDMLPGLTGYAQVSGRNMLSWEEKFILDVWYVDHWSLGLDVKILAKTIGKVFTREGISPAGQAVAEEFMGTPTNPNPDIIIRKPGSG
jgi:sugar transferase EpsL